MNCAEAPRALLAGRENLAVGKNMAAQARAGIAIGADFTARGWGVGRYHAIPSFADDESFSNNNGTKRVRPGPRSCRGGPVNGMAHENFPGLLHAVVQWLKMNSLELRIAQKISLSISSDFLSLVVVFKTSRRFFNSSSVGLRLSAVR